MNQIVVASFLLLGCTFLLLASVGVIRMPDLFMRMSASAKAGTLGIGCLLVALILQFQERAVTTKSILVIAFYFLVSPVAAHMIARAAYIVGVPLWKHSVSDEARDLYPRRRTDVRRHGIDIPAADTKADEEWEI